MANTLRFKRGLASGIPTALAGEPLFTTDTFDLYIGNGTTNTRFQKYIASGATTQILRGDGSLYTFPLAISSPSSGQVLKYNGTSWVNDSDAGITGSGTSGQVAYFTGASTLGNSIIFDNGTSVGISSASPSAGIKLQVDGAVFVNRSGNVNYVLNSASSHYGFIQNDAGNKWSLSSGTSLTSGLGTAALTWFSTGNVSIGNLSDNGLRFQVTGDGYFSGSVGVGTSTLTTSLTLGSGTTGLSFQSANTSLNSGKIAVIRPIEVGSGNGHLVFETYQGGAGGGVRMYLDSSGNLGLGVTPSAWLSSFRALQLGEGSSLWGAATGNNAGFDSNVYVNSSGASVYIGSTTATRYQQYAGTHAWYIAPSGSAGNAITFTQAMTLDASGILLVGGTTVGYSGTKLHVGNTSDSQNGLQILTSTTGVGYILFGDGGGASAYVGEIAYIHSDNAMRFRTNAIEGFRLTSNQNLLIGSTSDSGERLQVTGTAKITGATTFGDNVNLNGGVITFGGGVSNSPYTNSSWIRGASGAGTFITNNGITAWLGLKSNGDLDYNGGFTILASTGAATFSNALTVTGNLTVDTNTLFVDATNNRVGIGTASPLNTLFVTSSTSGDYSAFIENTNSTNGYGLLARTAHTGTSAYAFAARAGSTDIFVVRGDGNVGISTATPSYKLDVSGSARVSDAIAIGTTPDTNNPFKILKNINTTVGIKFENTNTSSLAFSAVQLGNDITGGTAFANLVYGSSGITESGVYKPSGTALINTGSGGLNFLAVSQPIRFFTSTGNGTLRAAITNDGDFTQYNGTNPSASTTDAFRMYSADVTAGNAAPHFRTENGAVIKLYQETNAVGSAFLNTTTGATITDTDTFDGYTLQQVVKALRNLGILQ